MTRLLAALRGRLESLPLPALLAIGGLVLLVTGAGGYYAYETWDYIEHDNNFCFECHLMQEPFELFAQSAHRGLGCKACHQPNMIERSSMGLTAVIENPDSIEVHAAVPNDLCADCHINGDPEAWLLVANSAGHKVHFESEDPDLQGLQCVECHSSSLHQFTAADETCAQSGCHTESDVQLGAMSDLTIHCAACHGFNTPVTDTEAALAAMAPDQDTCLSCHAMRALVELPDPDPHEASCASCHNPHEQSTPAEASGSCTAAGCHDDAAEVTPYHVGLDEAVAQDCLYCHQAHDFQIDGANCVACHQDVLDDDPAAVRRSAGLGGQHPSLRGDGRVIVASVLGGVAEAAMHSWGYPIPQELDFLHSEHASVECADCHESVERHGAVTVTTVTDCRSCHHEEGEPSVADCTQCHADSESTGDPYSVTQTLLLSTGTTVTRGQPFDHAPHDGLDCASCHTEGLDKSAAPLDCASCHEEHHVATTSCMSCHVTVAAEPHTIETSHVTCSGAGCHQDAPLDGVPRTNEVCLVCHQDQVDHEPDGLCADCHAMPDAGRT